MSLPKIYIQIPHYNNASFLIDCISSVGRIDYPNFNSVLVNDCSSDQTIELLDTIKLPENMEVIHNSKRLGRVQNYQFAFSQRRDAKWLINLDSDDYYTDKDWIKNTLQIVHENPLDNIVHIQSNFLTRIRYHNIPIIKTYGNGFYLVSGLDYVKLCIKYYGFSHLSSIFNIELIENCGAYTDDCLHTDFLTAARAALQGNVLIGSNEIGVWRKHDGNQSSQRYDDKEYAKNQISYYRFFVWCENYIPFNQLKSITNIFEKREIDRKLISSIQTRSLSSFRQFTREENASIWSLIQSIIRIFLSDFDSEKMSNISHGLFTRISSVIITLLVLPFILENLGVEEYSWIGIFTTISSAIYIFDFGLTNIITKEITQRGLSSKDSLKMVIASQEVVYISIGLFIFFILFISSNWLSLNWFFNNSGNINANNIFGLIALATLAQWPHSFYTGVLFGLNKQTLSNYMQLGVTLIKNIGIVFLFNSISASIELFFYWHICISLLTILIQKAFIYKEVRFINPLRFFSLSYLHQLKSIAFGISIISFFGFIYGDVNNFLLTRWLSKSDFGYYAILYNIVVVFIMYCATVKSALFPYISKTVLSEPLETVQENYKKHIYIISYSLIPLITSLVIFRDELLILWLKNNIIVAKVSSSFAFITIGSLCNALMIIPWTYLIAMSKPRVLIVLTCMIALISIPLLYFLVSHFLFEGASLYWLIINLLPLPPLLFYTNSFIHIRHTQLLLHSLFIPILTSIVITLSAYFVVSFLNLSPLITYSILLLSLLTTYFVILFYRYFMIEHKI